MPVKKLLEKIVNSRPVVWVLEKAKEISFPGNPEVKLYELVPTLITKIEREGVNVRAAAISFNFMMAIPALVIFLATLVPFFPNSGMIFDELIAFINSLTPNMRVRSVAVKYLSDVFSTSGTGIISLSILIALFYSSRAMMGIINSFDRSIRFTRSRGNVFQRRMRAIFLTLVIIFMLIATLLVSLGQGNLFNRIMSWLKIENEVLIFIIKNFRWLLIIALFYFSISFMYKFGPSVETRARFYSSGSWFATLLIILTTSLFSIWAQNFSAYNKFYGPIGSIMLVMLLIYIDSFLLLIGFELNNSLALINDKKKKEALEESEE